MIKFKRMTAALLCVALLCSAFMLASCSLSNDGQRHMVTYELNYDGSGTRQMSVPDGSRASEWRAYRDGYELEGWYTDSECTDPFDFSQEVSGNCTLYANWVPKGGYVEVTFDYDYVGRVNKTVSLKANRTIPEEAIPSADNRLGMIFAGWYTDKQKTQQWDMENDVLTEDTTLYAKYEINPAWVARNDDGSVKYENEIVEVWCEDSYNIDYSVFLELVSEFNAQHEGEITIKPTDKYTSQTTLLLRAKRTANNLASGSSAYYNVADVFTAAGIDLDLSGFYENGIRDVYSDGVMMVYPFAAEVPYLIYNKALMEKYWSCIDNHLPTNYTEFTTLLRAAYEGESSRNANFQSIIQTQWHFEECSSMIPFAQNGVEYYRFENGKKSNDWDDTAMAEKVKNTMSLYYDVFGAEGTCHGNGMFDNGGILNNVIAGNALFGVVGMSSADGNAKVANNSGTIDVMSFAGLFSDSDDEYSGNIPLYTMGIAFCKYATACSGVQICASAEFAKFLSENADRFADKGLVPLNKEAYARYLENTSASVQVLHKAISPENFYTLAGTTNQKYIITSVVASPNLSGYLNGDGTDLDEVFEAIRRAILAK